MAEPLFASVTDLQARIQGGVDDAARAGAALADVSARIHLHSKNKWILEDGTLDPSVPGVCKAVCCAAARRVLENPETVKAHTEQIDNFAETRTYAVDSNDPYLKKSEIADIRAAARISGLSTITTTRGDLETPRVRDGYPYDPETEGIPWQ